MEAENSAVQCKVAMRALVDDWKRWPLYFLHIAWFFSVSVSGTKHPSVQGWL